ncbi:unnamed protein product [Orchesella dallaii]|uniref:Protein tyrosine phosphatase domain-containing protein 1 n=1 Tax=Orchesella dallaii TaxID=48710 RepID=A0ABP1Q039_9HEXA
MDDFTVPGSVVGQSNGEPINLQSHYNKFSESFRRVAPPQLQCTVFCGGKRCKYESATFWGADACAINGVYSHWITDDIIAMSRLSTPQIEEFDIIGQFHTMGIKSVINLEVPGEHASCSLTPLHPGGFAYDPTALMDNGIYFYNYAWRDYAEASLAHLLDMVKVLSFAISQGKAAIHCHAGLGRTGVLIACYLVYAMRLRANDAIRLVRNKRPGSIPSRLHILCVQQFEQFILPNCIIYCNRDILKDKKLQDFTLQQYLKRQKFILHGRECKTLRHIPKILNVICERLLLLCGQPAVLPSTLDDDEPLPIAGTPDTIASPDGIGTMDGSMSPRSDSQPPSSSNSCIMDSRLLGEKPYKPDEIVRALLSDHINMSEGLARYVRQYRLELNHKGLGAWSRLAKEKNLYVLTTLLYFWLEHLRVALFGSEELTTVVLHASDARATLRKLPLEISATVDYIFNFIANLEPEPDELEAILKRFAAAITHRIVPTVTETVIHQGFHTQIPDKGKSRKLNDGTLNKLMTVLYGIVILHNSNLQLPPARMEEKPNTESNTNVQETQTGT